MRLERKRTTFPPYPPCTVWPELRPEDVDENLLRFTCYVAVCYTVYGASYNYYYNRTLSLIWFPSSARIW